MASHWFTEAHGLEFAEFENRIVRACSAVRGVDIGDVQQQTYLDLLKAHRSDPKKFPTKEDLLRYAAACARNFSWRTVRTQKRREGVGVGLDMDTFSAREEGADEVARTRLRALLADCDRSAALLDRYPSELREVYFRRCILEPREDVARALGISESTVRRRELAALKLLQLIIESDKDQWGLE